MNQERWFYFTLAALATWRLTHLLAHEDGPGDVIASLRQRLGESFLGNLLDCFYCLSLWIAAPMAYLFMNQRREWPLLWLALSAAACLLERVGNPPPAIQVLPQGEKDS